MAVNSNAKRKICRENAYRDKGVTPPRGFSSTKSKTEPKPSLVMKPIIPFALLGALLAVGAANAASTDPVGYVSLGNTAGGGAPAVAAGSEVTISVPLLRAADFTGTATSASGTTVNVTQALTAGAYNAPATGDPYVLEISSGALSGVVVPIASNTANSITVVLNGENLDTLAAGSSFSIRRAWTLSSFFAGNTLPDNVQLAAFDVQPGVNNSANPLYIYFGGSWFNGASGYPADNVILYPGESFVLINGTATNIASLTVTGDVPTSNSRIQLFKDGAAAQDTRVSYFTPTDEVIGQAGFVGLTDNDALLAFNNSAAGVNKSASQTVIYFGGSWFDGASGTDVTNTFKLKGGEGYVFRRAGAAPVGTVKLSDQQSYITNL